MNQKAFATPQILIFILALAAVVGGYFAFGTKTQAPQTPIDISGWKTYTNSQYGFEFKYSSRWSTNDTTKGADFSYLGEKIAVLKCPIREVGYEAWDVMSPSTRELSKNGKAAPVTIWDLQDKDRKAAADFSLILFNQSDFIQSCQFGLVPGVNYSSSTARAIFSSFQLIDQISSSTIAEVNTSNWQIYTNRKYGFEIKFPSYLRYLETYKPDDDHGAILRPNNILTDFYVPENIMISSPTLVEKSGKTALDAYNFTKTDIVKPDKFGRQREILENYTIKINGVDIYILISLDFDNRPEAISFINGGNSPIGLEVLGNPSTNQELKNFNEKILSTFKFISPAGN